MFRPTRILQVAVASLFLAGCAATNGGHGATAAGALNQQNQTIVSNDRINSSRSGNPGKPLSAPGDFLDAQGRLVPEVLAFAQETASTRQVPLNNVESLLKSARYDATAVRLMTPPARSGRIRRAWLSYRKRHVDPIRIRRGVEFWQANRRTLDRVSALTGVPASIMVAIIGIETVYGQYTGDHRVLDTLTTLGFRYPDPSRPERQSMFRNQLADLIVLDYQGVLDAHTVEGSFAGAMGLPQFMPGSLMRYAVSHDGRKQVDLTNIDDAIASVGNFLKAHGWVRDVPVFAPVRLPSDASELAQDGLEPLSDWVHLEAEGTRALPGGDTRWQAQPLGVIDLQDETRGTHEYRCATPNFFAITKYNRSYFYAASVADLASEITSRMGA